MVIGLPWVQGNQSTEIQVALSAPLLWLQAASSKGKLALPSPTVIPLVPQAPEGLEGLAADKAQLVESKEEHLLRLRRELNRAVREGPGNLEAWLELAGLQDTLSQYALSLTSVAHRLRRVFILYMKALLPLGSCTSEAKQGAQQSCLGGAWEHGGLARADWPAGHPQPVRRFLHPLSNIPHAALPLGIRPAYGCPGGGGEGAWEIGGLGGRSQCARHQHAFGHQGVLSHVWD